MQLAAGGDSPPAAGFRRLEFLAAPEYRGPRKMRLASYRFGSSLCALASIVAFFALLAAPALHIHSPLNHFRTPTVRRLVQRHTSLEETTVDPAPQPAPFEQRTPLSLPVADVAHEQAANLREVALPDSPVLRPHLKLGFSRSSASDPLL